MDSSPIHDPKASFGLKHLSTKKQWKRSVFFSSTFPNLKSSL